MNPVRLGELARALGGEVRGGEPVLGAVAIDSRRMTPDGLFVALPGSRADGHDFVAGLHGRAAAALVARWVDSPLPQWRVTDPAVILAALGRHCRRAVNPIVIGVTGSNGKTTVKELTALMLGRAGATLATAGNYNNTLGVPLTLCRLDSRHRFAVIEMGAGAAGEIAPLAEWAAPGVAVVTNAYPAHLSGFGDLETVVRTKGELFAALGPNGVAVLNAGSPHRQAWRRQIRERPTVTFGAGETAADVIVRSAGPGEIAVRWPGGERVTRFSLLGAHNRWNAAAAIAAVHAAGVEPEQVLDALGAAESVPGRLALETLAGGARLIDDSYNANPASVAAALDAPAELPGERWLVLGDMAELGATGAERHAEAGAHARAAGVTRLFATGPLARATVAGFGEGGCWFNDREALTAALTEALHEGVAVLVKGSRSAGMETVVRALRDPTGKDRGGASCCC